jgi:hypothetical protein
MNRKNEQCSPDWGKPGQSAPATVSTAQAFSNSSPGYTEIKSEIRVAIDVLTRIADALEGMRDRRSMP